MNLQYLKSLVREFVALPAETEWVEFKCNNADPQAIGEYLSALSNAAAINQKSFGWLVWGIENQTHQVIGTHSSGKKRESGA